MTSKWIYAHRGTKRDIERGVDFYRVGPELDVTDPECACPTIPDEWRAKQIVNSVNASIEALATKDALIERLKSEAQIHACEARTANSIICEIYQSVSGAKGEPGNWNGAEPVRAYIATKDAEIARLENEKADLIVSLKSLYDLASGGGTIDPDDEATKIALTNAAVLMALETPIDPAGGMPVEVE